ncbi:TauD/TfdA family dioxygenase [Streptomyces sp. MUM 2J]|uniref:TauD/TfdA family dioxygenase n=1 Tax=Streptomyces sp. MUM 2J TaxID=2791987 RepID=UPI001F03D904|nr:TauD/TfdA family dioxygenase [Streptomyces sp. MUM 2J]MCH0562156.1 TauD/TfdA family dioxygenase [Streptomyces sp. MUM 2J]
MTPLSVPEYRVALPKELVAELAQRAADLPEWRLGDDGLLSPETAARYHVVLAGLPRIGEFTATCHRLLDAPEGEGFAVLELAELFDAAGPEEAGMRAVTALVSLIATPLRAFDRWPLWKPLGTNLTIDPMRATGSGYNPMHIDVVNSTFPPDYSALLCVRPDPRGQGHSLVSQVRRAVDRLGYSDAELLTHPKYVDGAFFELTGVGEEWKPFPILDGQPPTEGFVRFTAKMLADADPADPYIKAARSLERELITGQRRFLLGRGDMLIANQHLCCHGREPLGGGQEDVPEDERRLLLQIFLRGQVRHTAEREVVA